MKFLIHKVMIKIYLWVFVGLIIGACSNTSNTKHNEKYYQSIMCKKLGGIIEYKLPDKTRIDCLTEKYAIEVDWATKWAESIGQSLYYSKMTNKQPAVGLIMGKKDNRFLKRFRKASKGLNIKVFILDKN